MYYGVLVMVVCDSEGIVYDLWFHPASYHEVRSLRYYFTCLPLWLRYRLVAFSGILKYGGNFSSDVSNIRVISHSKYKEANP